MTTTPPRSEAEENVLGDASAAWVHGIPWSRRAAFAMLLIAAFLVSAEMTARVTDRVRSGTPLLATPDLRTDLVVRDSLGPRGRPNGRFERWQLNSAGFRSPESVLSPVPGCVRVMVLGASESFGAEAESPGKEYPAQLADSLAAFGCYQVMNAAIAGVTTPGMIGLWTSWASRYHPDIVVVLANPMFYLSDEAPTFPHPVTGHERGPPWTPRLLLRARDLIQYPAYIQRRRIQRQLAALTSGHPDSWLFRSVPGDRLGRYRQDLDSLVSTIRSHGASPVLATYPTRVDRVVTDADAWELTAYRQFCARALPDAMLAFADSAAGAVRELGEERGIRIVDLRRLVGGRRELFNDFVHYTDTGAGVVAGNIARVVRAAAVPPAARPVSR